MVDDALALGVKHAALNVWLNEYVDLAGRVITSSDPSLAVDVSGEPWFAGAAAGPVISSIADEGGHLRWYVSAPVAGANDRPEAVVVGLLRPAHGTQMEFGDDRAEIEEASGEIAAHPDGHRQALSESVPATVVVAPVHRSVMSSMNLRLPPLPVCLSKTK